MRLSPLVGVLSAAALLAGCTPSESADAAPTPPMSTAQTSLLRADIDALLRSGATGVLVTVTDHGRTQTLTGGFADLATSRPIPADPPQQVRVGSITKTFTSAVVLQLVGEGRIRLDEPIETYLPGLLRGDGIDGHAITVRHLLRHQSGLPELTADERIDEYRAAQDNRIMTPAEEMAIALSHPAEFAPGAHARYSNTNYIVAGMLIEKVTATPYSDQLTRRILKPLHLTDTYLPAPGDHTIHGPHPTGYATIADKITDVTGIEPSIPWSAGALISTGPDLNRFYTELRAGEVVPPTQLNEMLDTIPLENAPDFPYGLGLTTKPLPCDTTFSGHTGGIYGFTTISGATPQSRAVTITVTGTPTTRSDLNTILPHALCP